MPVVFWTDAHESVGNKSLKDLCVVLPEADQARAKRYRQPLDAHQFALGRLLLGYALQQNGSSLQALHHLQYGTEGKPYLKKGGAFSIAHSRGVVACAWSKATPLGLDVEVPQSIQRAHFRHCFTPMEWAAIQADASLGTFYHYWTAKEAVLKAQGWGLGHLQEVQIEAQQMVSIAQKSSELAWKAFEIGAARACLCSSRSGLASLELQFVSPATLIALSL